MAVGVSRSVVWRIERGHADRVTLATLVRVSTALDARVDVRLLWHGENLDRLIDARHARLVESMLERLVPAGWLAATEVSFNVRGERGSIDILGFHPSTRSLLVIEVKSVVPDLQAMLHGIDRKSRVGAAVGRERAWEATTVSRILLLPNEKTARRRLATHRATFDAALPARTLEVRRWLRRPHGAISGVLFVSDAHQRGNRL